jgi:hypothetical protein
MLVAIEFSCFDLSAIGCHPNNLQWRMDDSGGVSCQTGRPPRQLPEIMTTSAPSNNVSNIVVRGNATFCLRGPICDCLGSCKMPSCLRPYSVAPKRQHTSAPRLKMCRVCNNALGRVCIVGSGFLSLVACCNMVSKIN